MRQRIIAAVGAIAAVVLFGLFGAPQLLFEEAPEEEVAAENADKLVVLLHGMGRSPAAMFLVEQSLQRQGYQVLNWGYSSTCCSVEELGTELAEDLDSLEAPRPTKIHFVGHSLGNIIIRWALENAPPDEPGRVVMLAPPNQGSASADRYAEWAGWLLEPIDELVTDDDSTARSLSTIEDREVGIIAGEYDGKIDVERTKLGTEEEHETVPAAHTFIMNRSDVREKIISFLADGSFD